MMIHKKMCTRLPRYFALALCLGSLLWAQENPPLTQALIDRVPEMYRKAARNLKLAEAAQKYYLAHPERSLVPVVADSVARTPEGIPFLFDAVEKDPDANNRVALFLVLGEDKGLSDYVKQHSEWIETLQRHAAADPDPKAALSALKAIREMHNYEEAAALRERIAIARKAEDQSGLETLSEEESLHYKWFGEVAIPAAWRDAPPVFSVASADKKIRAVAFGDFGSGESAQATTAAAIRAYAKDHPLDFGLTLGDNFYPIGMASPSDPRWRAQWEDLYGPLGIKFYASLGNHDYGQATSPVSEFWYSEKSSSWSAPARYYTFTAGAAQFFQVDTVDLSERELHWLDRELEQSKAVWKIVYGHYQIYSATRGDNEAAQDDLVHVLLPILKKHKVDLYHCGHDHNLQILKADGGVHFVVAGGGGAGLYDFTQKNYDRNTFKEKANGFAILEADPHALNGRLINAAAEELSSLRLTK